ncbi:MAG: helix-turn-helix transcriptional regulator [Myxococcales bacterium]|nr:WYL domain-containing protein [Myxococcales bacterium]
MDKTERLLDLVALLLDAREPVSFAELREVFSDEYGGPRASAERKLERDKAELLQLGVPIEYVEPQRLDERELGGYRIDRKAFFLPDPKLLPEESAALYAAGAAALAAHDFPFAQDLAFALRKISLAGSGETAVASAAARRLLIVRPGDPSLPGKLHALGTAVARRKRVHVVYQSPATLDGKPPERTERDVDPYGLAFRGGSWRMVGYCHLRKALRTFLVARMESMEVNEQKPNTPDFEAPEGFDAGAVAGRRPWQWLATAPQTVKLVFAPGSEPLGERIFDTKDGNLQVRYLDGLIPQVLSLGDRVWIESPRYAREKAVNALQSLKARLAKDPSPPPQPPRAAETPPQTKPPRPDVRDDNRERLRRLLLVVPAARRKPGAPLDELARELGLDPAQLRADIDLLGLIGRPPFSPDDLIDISVDERGRVTVALDQSFSRPPQLTAVEALALAAAAEEVAPADPAVTAALTKLTEKLTPAARSLYSALARRVAASTPPPKGAFLAQLRKAAEQHKEIVLAYDKEGRGAAEGRTIRPQGVIEHAGVWYVIGHDTTRNAERTFRVDRIMNVQETGATFPDPGPLDPARFQREQLFFPSGHELPVVLRFSPAASAWALARYGSRAQSIDGGAVDAVIESAGTQYAVSQALSLAGEAEIVAPPEARQALRDAVDHALARYAP